MLIRATCQRKDLYNNIIQAIATSGLWIPVSSNPTEDYLQDSTAWPGTDGNIFKSTYEQRGQPIYFAIKQWSNWSTVVTDGALIRVHMFGGYIPGAPGTNGTKSNYYNGACSWLLNYLGTSLTQNLEYVISIEAHRIIIAVHQALDVTKYTNIFFIGFTDPENSIEGTTYNNAVMIPSLWSGNGLNTLMLKTPTLGGSIAYVNTLPTLLSTITSNPSYEGLYSMASIDVRYTLSTAFLGHIGSLDGLYSLPSNNLVHLDTLTVGTTQYLVLRCYYPTTTTSFGTIWFALKLG